MSEHSALADQIWTCIRAEARKEAERVVQAALRNLRPGGAHPLLVAVAAPTNNMYAALIPVLYPCVITSVDLMAEPGETGNAKVDLSVARPGQEYWMMLGSLLSDDVYLVDSDWTRTLPTAEPENWLTTHIEAGSVLVLWIHTVSGVSTLTISVNVRCL